MAAVAAVAGVGMSALYRRWPSKEDLLRTLVDEIETAYTVQLETAHRALDEGVDAGDVLRGYVLGLLAAGAAFVSPRMPGLAEAGATGQRWVDLRNSNHALFERLREAGVLREGLTFHDLGLLISAAGSVRGADAERTRHLQQRLGRVLLDGLRPEHPGLDGEGASHTDFHDPPAPPE